MSDDLDYITSKMKELQDLIEVVSFQQRKLQVLDDNLSRTKKHVNSFDAVLRGLDGSSY